MYYAEDVTLPVQMPHPTQQGSNTSPTGTNDSQMLVGCHGGGGGEVEASNWSVHNYQNSSVTLSWDYKK